MKKVFCLLELAVGLFADVNVTGNWTGTFSPVDKDGATHEGPALLKLKQTGTDITGTLGPSEDEQYPIAKGKLDGNKLTIEINGDGHNIRFDLVVAEDSIKGDAD